MSTLTVTTSPGVTRIELARPQLRNAFNAEVIAELRAAFTSLAEATRVVVLSGAGPMFCAGADLEWMQKSAGYSESENQADADALAAMLRAIDEAPAVVVCKLQGAALGGGVGLVACCDIVVAAAGAKLGFTEVRLGLVPAVISPFVVSKIGAGAARRYFTTGEVFDAERGERLGLVHDVVPAEELEARVESLVATLLKNGPRAVREAKRLVREVSGQSPAEARDATVRTIARLRTSPEGQEGLQAFLDKREPSWP